MSLSSQAGLRVGDIVIEFKGQPTTNMVEIERALQNLSPGEIVDLTILRLDEQNTFQRETILVTVQADGLGAGFMPI